MKGILNFLGALMEGRTQLRHQDRERLVQQIKDDAMPAEDIVPTFLRLQRMALLEEDCNPCTGLPYVEKKAWLLVEAGGGLNVVQAQVYLIKHPNTWRRVHALWDDRAEFVDGVTAFPTQDEAYAELVFQSHNRWLDAAEQAEKLKQEFDSHTAAYQEVLSVAAV